MSTSQPAASSLSPIRTSDIAQELEEVIADGVLDVVMTVRKLLIL